MRETRGDRGDSGRYCKEEMRAPAKEKCKFRLQSSESMKARGSGVMRLPEAGVAHGVPGSVHGLSGVTAPDGLRR